MYLPNADKATVKIAKKDYLLALEHPIGKSKAEFFTKVGFQKAKWKEFTSALLSLAQNNIVKNTENTHFGTKYIVEGNINAPNGNQYYIKTVWMIERQEDYAYLITAYPIKQ